MKKAVSVRRGARREEGMALLFALGFLALMLILGLGFVTTSLLAQKLAANNGSRAQARMFARSAMARAMLNVMLYNDQALLTGKSFENYDSICSYDKVDYNDGTGSGSSIDNKVSDGELSDQLRKSSDEATDGSKLKYQSDTEDYAGDDCQAKWIYFYDAPEVTTGRKIIGRAAYQVLPRGAAGWLSLYAVTGGSLVKNDYGAYPHSFRWGRDVAELNLENIQFKTDGGKSWYEVVTENNIPFKYETMYTSYNGFFKTDTVQKKRWIECWFAEGKTPILKDAFPVIDGTETKYFNRFNIGDYYYTAEERNKAGNDNWYDRFKNVSSNGNGWVEVTDELKNSADALDKLTGKAVEYNESHTTDLEVDPSGLPFLKRIGNDKWSFETLEHLRKQIAANFNDYCDADSIPTGNVKASEWSVTDSGKFPVYTGNEKTLYINEVAAQIGKIWVHYQKNDYALEVTNDLDIKMLVELVNMYDNSGDTPPPLLDPSHLALKFNLEEFSFKIALHGKYTGRITYKDKNGKSKNVTVNDTNAIEVNKSYNDDKFNTTVKLSQPVGVSISGTVVNAADSDAKFSTLEKGYSVGKASLTPTVINPEGSDFRNEVMKQAKALAKAHAGINWSDATSEASVKFSIQRAYADYKIVAGAVDMQLSPMMLMTKENVTVDGVTVPKDTGLDFVRFDRVGKMTVSGTLDPVTLTRVDNQDATYNKRTYFIGGIEANDPRQNLNPRKSDTPDVKSDWTVAPKLLMGSAAYSGESGAPTMVLTQKNSGDYDYEVNTASGSEFGRINRDASPAKTSSGSARSENEADKETAEDPAWLGDTAGQHVSTAYIRNAPMVSPWEIGLIHRAREWQTLNIKCAGGFGADKIVELEAIKSKYDDWQGEGTQYQNGDGAIMEFIKVGVGCRSMGKVPLKMLRTKVISGSYNGGNKVPAEWNGVKADYNRDIVKMLFNGIRLGQSMKDFYAETKFEAPSKQGGSEVTISDTLIDRFIKEIDIFSHDEKDEDGNYVNFDFRMRSQFLNSQYGDWNGKTPFGISQPEDNDALLEEVVGKTVNLLAVEEETPPNVFKVIVVAQSIKDVGGIGSDISISKGNNTLDCRIGRFDFVSDAANWENNVYFDEITGEAKMLVTVERVPAADDSGAKNKDYGRMVVTNIEFID